MSILKNGGWRGVGEFVAIRKEMEIGGQMVQVCSFDCQLDQNGQRRSRQYNEIRTSEEVVRLPASVRSLKAAIEAAEERYLG